MKKKELNKITESIIGAAIDVHRELGPGLLESSYELCLAHELVLTCIAPRTYVASKLSASVQANIRLRVVVLREPQHDGCLYLGVFDLVVGRRLSKADAQSLTIAF